jgi:hypothetical protein
VEEPDPLKVARVLVDEAERARGPWRRTVLAGARRHLDEARVAVAADDVRRREIDHLAALLAALEQLRPVCDE